MENIKTWADFGALTKEELDALTPEEIETLKKTIVENEEKLSKDREAELNKSTEFGESQKIRAEKAERKSKKEPEPKEKPDLSSDDILALAKANLHNDDMKEVREWAKYKKITVSEALEDKTMQNVISNNVEERKTAEATETGKSPRGTSKVSGETLIANAKEGKAPQDEKGIDALAKARMEDKMGEIDK